ncbi:MAG: thiamine diphosphokinase [Ignavibacteriaceae bacterium]|nr:thiamine diphosphokinase [Ignavibacteriaceae bacterium]
MVKKNKCIILANGKPPAKSVLSFLNNIGYSILICADGGANSARKLNVLPNYIIGDLDSINNDALKYYTGRSEIIKIKRQNDTDVEKCIKFAIKKKLDYIVLTGVTGDRLDHTFCNLGIVIKFSKLVNIRIIAESSLLAPYTGNVNLRTCSGETISLYGLDSKTKVLSEGLYYPLRNIALPFGVKESTSNLAKSNNIQLRISGGVIFVIRDLKTVIKHDLF